mmetsp:Transcript_32978/g.65427  ORF Transcript_32978/g.65427 Transcript_32978/m.65427 type:complete len:461 (-) Transcript_32978:347-1729(-)
MSGPSWPAECASCPIKLRDAAGAFAIWKCRQDHVFVVCTAECQRLLDKRCDDVVDSVERLERRKSNTGQSNVLRQLRATEREKLKQKEEAAKHLGTMRLCPAPVRVPKKRAQHCVPHCCHCMERCGGMKRMGEDKAISPPTSRMASQAMQEEAPGSAAGGVVLGDDMLVKIERDDEEEEKAQTPAAAKTKKSKQKSGNDRHWRKLLLDFGQARQVERTAAAGAASAADATAEVTEAAERAAEQPAVEEAQRAAAEAARAEAPHTTESPRRAEEAPAAPAATEEEEEVKEEEEEEVSAATAAQQERPATQPAWQGLVACWELVCVRHWRPRPEFVQAMRLIQGERVRVLCTDGIWAWGHALKAPARWARFPVGVLVQPGRPPRPWHADDVAFVAEPFEAPSDILGYMSVEPGDTIRLLRPTQEPHVWAYAQRIPVHGEVDQVGSPDAGWIPECVLRRRGAA